MVLESGKSKIKVLHLEKTLLLCHSMVEGHHMDSGGRENSYPRGFTFHIKPLPWWLTHSHIRAISPFIKVDPLWPDCIFFGSTGVWTQGLALPCAPRPQAPHCTFKVSPPNTVTVAVRFQQERWRHYNVCIYHIFAVVRQWMDSWLLLPLGYRE
jgi:hypothetical protein